MEKNKLENLLRLISDIYYDLDELPDHDAIVLIRELLNVSDQMPAFGVDAILHKLIDIICDVLMQNFPGGEFIEILEDMLNSIEGISGPIHLLNKLEHELGIQNENSDSMTNALELLKNLHAQNVSNAPIEQLLKVPESYYVLKFLEEKLDPNSFALIRKKCVENKENIVNLVSGYLSVKIVTPSKGYTGRHRYIHMDKLKKMFGDKMEIITSALSEIKQDNSEFSKENRHVILIFEQTLKFPDFELPI